MGDGSQGHPGIGYNLLPWNVKFQFKAVCIKRFCRPPMWPLLRPLAIYDFYMDENGMLGVDCDHCDEKNRGRHHVLFWVNTSLYNQTIDFDEYFIKIND